MAAVLLVGCSAGRSQAPTARPTPEPTETPAAWDLSVADTSFTTKTRVGDDVNVSVEVKNAGTAASPGVRLQFDGQGDYMDLVGCNPKCDYSDFFGLYLDMPGVPAGESKVYKVQFIAKAIGVADLSICLYDDADAGNQVWCGDGSVQIRK